MPISSEARAAQAIVRHETEQRPPADILVRTSSAETGKERQRDVQTLIDSVVAKSPRLAAVRAPETVRPLSVTSSAREEKLILLTRTLSGLVDLIIVILSGSALILAVDVLIGIEVFDAVSIVHYSTLLLMTYFLYSLFFLGTGGQTVGMMLTDLRVVGVASPRPSPGQILVRSIAYVLGSAALGIGLIWGCFDRQSRCLHDRFSHTKTVRVLFS